MLIGIFLPLVASSHFSQMSPKQRRILERTFSDPPIRRPSPWAEPPRILVKDRRTDENKENEWDSWDASGGSESNDKHQPH